MAKSLKPDAFFQTLGVILDVRSPAEYNQGHIPGAVNFPLFNNEETGSDKSGIWGETTY